MRGDEIIGRRSGRMVKTTSTEEDPGSHFIGTVGASVVTAVGLAIFPPFAILGVLGLLARRGATKEVGKRMDSQEMADTHEIAETWASDRQSGESSISVTRTRDEGGGLIPLWVNRTHTYSLPDEDDHKDLEDLEDL